MTHYILKPLHLVIIALLLAGVTACSKKDDDKPNAEQPPAVNGLQVVSSRTDAFIIEWQPVSDVLAYVVFIALDENFTQQVPGQYSKIVSGTRDTIRGLTPDTKYFIKVQAARESVIGDPAFAEGRTGNEDVYITGWDLNVASPVSSIGYWFNGTWVPHVGVNNELAGGTTGAFVTGYDVYVAGFVGTQASNYEAYYWKNGVPFNLGAGTASGIAVAGNDVYVSGTQGLGVGSKAGYWKNGTWVVASALSFASEAAAIVVNGGDVYLAGYEGNGTNMIPKYWKNGEEVILQSTTGRDAFAKAIVVAGADVYVAGYELDGIKTLAVYWKNGVLIPISNASSEARGLFVKGDDVFVSGSDGVGTGSPAFYWKNGLFQPLEVSAPVGVATGISVKGNDIYLVGTEVVSGNGLVRYWKGNTLAGSVVLTVNGYGNSIVVK